MVRIEVHGQRLARIRMDGESLGDWQICGEGILGRRCLCGTVSTPKGHRQSVRTGDVNRDWIIGRIRELEASAQARVVTVIWMGEIIVDTAYAMRCKSAPNR